MLGLASVAVVTDLGTTVVPASASPTPTFTLEWSHLLNDTHSPVALSSPTVADLPSGPAAVFGDRAGNVYAYNLSTGAEDWDFSTGGVPVDSPPSVAPINANGIDSVYVGVGNSADPNAGGYQAISPTGSSLWFHNATNPTTDPTTDNGVQAGLAVGDLQGGTDVVAGSLGENEYAMNATNGSVLNGFPWFDADSNFTTPAIADVLHNGQNQIVEGGDSTAGTAYQYTYSNGGHLRILSANGNAGTSEPNDGLVCQYNTNETVQSSPAVGEFFGNSNVGVVFGTGTTYGGVSNEDQVLAVNSSCGLAWSHTLDGSTASSPALADVLGNGGLQVVEGTSSSSTTGSVWALNGANGATDWQTSVGPVTGSVVTADLTNSGYQDVLVPLSGSPSLNGLDILDGKTGQIVTSLGSDLSQGIFLQNSPLVTEDANGSIGITLAGYNAANQGIVAHYEVNSSSGANVNETGAWPMFHHDPQLTGDAGTPFTLQVPCSAPTATPKGYYLLGSDGGVFNFGNLPFCGSTGSITLAQPMVAIVPTHDAGGYWTVARDGGTFAFGDAAFVGSLPGAGVHVTNIVGMVPTRSGGGYWMVGSDGGAFAFGNAGFVGSLPGDGVHVNNIVGIVPTSDNEGYWMVGSDGGVFGFGDAHYVGSLPGDGVHVNNVVGIVPTSNNEGYWMVGSDGGTFAFGNASYLGSLPGDGVHVNNIVGIASTSNNGGYWMVGTDGGTFAFGDAGYEGSLPGIGVHVNNIVGIAGAP